MVEAETGKAALAGPGGRERGAAKRRVPAGSGVGVAPVSPVAASGLPQVVSAIRLHQRYPMNRSHVDPVVAIEAVLVDLALIDVPHEKSRRFLAASVRRVHLGRVALLWLAVLQDVELIGTGHAKVENRIRAGDRPQSHVSTGGEGVYAHPA